VRDLLNLYQYDGDNIPIIRGSALAAATGGDTTIGRDAIYALMDAVRYWIYHIRYRLSLALLW
jgi:elongation factor Tu